MGRLCGTAPSLGLLGLLKTSLAATAQPHMEQFTSMFVLPHEDFSFNLFLLPSQACFGRSPSSRVEQTVTVASASALANFRQQC